MKIINLYSSFDTMHGATKWAMSFATELVNQGHDSQIICSRFEIDKPYWLQAKIISSKRSLKPTNRLLKVLANYLNMLPLFWLVPRDSNVIIFHAEASTALLPFLRLRCPSAKLVYYCYQPPREAYDLWPLVKKDYSLLIQFFLTLILPIYRMIDRFLIKWADMVLVWSDEYEEYVKNIYGINCIEQLPACVDFNVFTKHDEKIVNRLTDQFESADKIILMNATLTRKKRVDLLVRVLAELKNNDRNIHALIIGEGCLKDELLELASSLGVSDRFHLLGYVTQEELPCYYFVSDVLFYLEPQGAWSLSIIEAGASGIPVVVAPGGSMKTLVKDWETGIILPEAADAMEIANKTLALLDDELICSDMGNNNRNYLMQFSLENAIKQFLRMVE